MCFEVFDVEEDILCPEAGAFSDGDDLCGLVVCESKSGEVFVFLGEGFEIGEDIDSFCEYDFEAFAEEDEVGVVPDVAGCGTEVDNRQCFRCDFAVGVDVGHDVVACF